MRFLWAASLVLGGCFATAPVDLYDCSDEHNKPCKGARQVCVEFECYDICDNHGQCPAAQACVESTCRDYAANCESTADCLNGWHCGDSGACSKPLPAGSPCGMDASRCLSG